MEGSGEDRAGTTLGDSGDTGARRDDAIGTADTAETPAAGATATQNGRSDKNQAGAGERSQGGQRAGKQPGRPSRPGNRSGKHSNRAYRDQRPSCDRNWDVYSALDLGTNNCRLLIARPSRRGFSVVDAFSRIIRLGEGVSQSGRLCDAAMDRTIDALKVCASKMVRNQVVRSYQVATEACRIANNSDVFLARVRDEVGFDIEVLSHENEARLAVSGCASLIDSEADLALVFDIGGGSSELIWLDMTKRKQKWRRSLAERLEAQDCITAWTSLPVGVVTLAEKFGGCFVDEAVFEGMVAYVMELLAPFEREHCFAERAKQAKTHFLGTSGTVTTVAGVHLGLPRYDRNRVDGCWLRSQDIKQVTASLLGYTYDQRVAEPCIGRDRADLVLAGCAILEGLLNIWPCERLRVADRGLREGMLVQLMAEDGVLSAGRDRQRNSRRARR